MPLSSPSPSPAQTEANYVGTWATAVVSMPSDQVSEQLNDAILVQNVRVSVGGERVRLRLSNVFGDSELVVGSASLALLRESDRNATEATTQRTPLSFNGQSGITIPAGTDTASDPLDFALPPLADVVITLHLKKAPKLPTGHDGCGAPVSYFRPASSTDTIDNYRRASRWYFISGLDIATAQTPRAVVLFGDSITDGAGVPPSGNRRWGDELSRRLRATPATADIGVLNQGIGGNRLLNDGNAQRALDRFERDVLQQPGVRWVIVLIGINDLGQARTAREASLPAPTAPELIAGYEQLIDRAHAAGLKIYGSPILPYKDCPFYWSEEGEVDRQTINEWIRNSGRFDAVIDFEAVLCDPANPLYLLEKYDLGDFLHPNPDGLTAMGASIDLALFSA